VAKLLDFRVEGGRYVFRWRAPGDDFYKCLWKLKERIPFTQRSFDGETRFWSVGVNDHNRSVLMALFENGRSCIETAEAQLRLF